jgi:hypothetical protein
MPEDLGLSFTARIRCFRFAADYGAEIVELPTRFSA